MCGHATLAVAHALRTTGVSTGTVRFATRSGVLSATAGDDNWITLDFPTAVLTPVDAVEVVGQVSAALGADVRALYDTGPDTDDLLAELADEAAVRALAPDLAALAGLSRRGVIATAVAADPDRGAAWSARSCVATAPG